MANTRSSLHRSPDAVLLILALSASGAFAQAPRGGPNQPEQKILAKFDQDGNGRLEGAERDAARAELKKAAADPSQPGQGRRGRGGRGMPPGPGGDQAPMPPGAAQRGAAVSPGPKVTPAEVVAYPTADLFDPSVVRTVFLDFDLPNWEEELELFHGTDADVPAKLTVDGKVIEGVGVRFRGASSYFMLPRGAKRSFNVSIDHTDPQARVGGQTTLNLLNCNGDASMMSTALYALLAGTHLPTPRANHVQVVVNGESWGVFVNVEQFNKAFLHRAWPEFDAEGARWKVHGSPQGTGGLDDRGTDLAAYRQRYELKSKEREEDWAALVTLCTTLSNTPIDGLQAALEPMLDVDGVLWFLALDIVTANSDGYWTRASDYSLYRDPKGVFHVIPHDMNEAFKGSHGGPGGRGGPGGPGGRGRRFAPEAGGPPNGPDDFAPRGPDGARPDDFAPRGPDGAPPDDFAPRGPDGARPDDFAPRGPDGAPRPEGGEQRRGPMRAGGRSMIELDPLTGMDDPTKPLRSRLLQVPELRAKYIEHVKTLAAAMAWDKVGPFVAQQRALLEPFVARDTRKPFPTEVFLRDTAPDASTGSLAEFFQKRGAFLTAWQPAAAGSKPTGTPPQPAPDQSAPTPPRSPPAPDQSASTPPRSTPGPDQSAP